MNLKHPIQSSQINTPIMIKPAGPHQGRSTHHQDQLITQHNLSTTKIHPKTLNNPN